MGRNVWIFAWLFLAATVAAALLISPQSREAGKRAKAAQLEFERYRVYDIGAQGVTQVVIAEKGRHYADREELESPILIRQNNGQLQGLSAKTAVMVGPVVTLRNEVHYWSNEGHNLFTEEAVYNKQTQILKGRGGFTLEWAEGRMSGREFEVDGAARTVDAREVRAILEMKE